ncbi:24976_t:CDS:2 [Cetraspora pellucida]|uniref:24976_t:CDS:1 n=1 Tax=Cetraspora pellucida TaxID=1433469 RepID=A0A9N9DLT6_9GLOM|nr:24976_t:CDS:2 [Cetraspora pellucida]
MYYKVKETMHLYDIYFNCLSLRKKAESHNYIYWMFSKQRYKRILQEFILI